MKKTYKIKGMHCVSCEILLGQELKSVPGIKNAKVSHKSGTAEIEFENETKDQEVENAVLKSGYQIKENLKEIKDSSQRFKNILEGLGIFIIVALAISFISRIDISHFFPDLEAELNLFVAIGIGIVASLSTCLALTGGIVMSFSAKIYSKEENPTLLSRAKPQIYFHAGRLASFFVLGGALGAIGDTINFSPSFMSILLSVVAIIMFYLGLNIMGLVPNITNLGFHLPKSWAKKIKNQEKKDHHLMPLILGALTFFLPCGFTQSMQLSAVASGSFLSGALLMLFFALGTLPVLFSVGLGSSFAKNKDFSLVKKFIGALIIVFAIFSLNNAIVLAGGSFKIGVPHTPNHQSDNKSDEQTADSQINKNVQVVKMEIDNIFMDTEFKIKKGIPVRFEINVIRTTGCSNEVIIPKFDLSTGKLKKGINILEFTPTESGIIPFSCWMGMQTGRFVVE